MDIFRNSTIVLVLCVFLAGKCTNAANILVYGAVGAYSARLSMFPMMEGLAERGHNVTFLSPFDNIEDPQKKLKITFFTPPKLKELIGRSIGEYPAFELRKSGTNPQGWMKGLNKGVLVCETLWSDPIFLTWVKTSPKFDLIISEGYANECSLGLVHLHKSKFIIYGTSTPYPWFMEAYRFPDETSTIPNAVFDFAAGDHMTFVQRVMNALCPIVFRMKREYSYFPALEEITRQGLGLEKEELPSFREMEKRTSLVFITSHATIDLPRSLPPHVIPVGGAVVNTKPKLLSPEVETFINSATSGFIYISFGTVVEFTKFERDVQLEFIQALGSFPEIKFLWKAAIQINETLPKNTMQSKWLPQQTVLGHPKIKGFVTHCGMGSTAEAVHFGVPLVMLPVIGDQDGNANVMEARGVGVQLELTTLKKEELEYAISEILNNNKYRISMKKLSAAFKDRTMKPSETAVWWVEYILRHDNSNDYLVPLSVQQQPWWKRRQLDVWLFLGACLGVCVSIILVVFYHLVIAAFGMLFLYTAKKIEQKAKRKSE